MPRSVQSVSAYPWRLTARIGNVDDTHFYRSRRDATIWAISYLRKRYSVQIHKYKDGQYVESPIPEHIRERARQEAY